MEGDPDSPVETKDNVMPETAPQPHEQPNGGGSSGVEAEPRWDGAVGGANSYGGTSSLASSLAFSIDDAPRLIAELLEAYERREEAHAQRRSELRELAIWLTSCGFEGAQPTKGAVYCNAPGEPDHRLKATPQSDGALKTVRFRALVMRLLPLSTGEVANVLAYLASSVKTPLFELQLDLERLAVMAEFTVMRGPRRALVTAVRQQLKLARESLDDVVEAARLPTPPVGTLLRGTAESTYQITGSGVLCRVVAPSPVPGLLCVAVEPGEDTFMVEAQYFARAEPATLTPPERELLTRWPLRGQPASMPSSAACPGDWVRDHGRVYLLIERESDQTWLAFSRTGFRGASASAFELLHEDDVPEPERMAATPAPGRWVRLLQDHLPPVDGIVVSTPTADQVIATDGNRFFKVPRSQVIPLSSARIHLTCKAACAPYLPVGESAPVTHHVPPGCWVRPLHSPEAPCLRLLQASEEEALCMRLGGRKRIRLRSHALEVLSALDVELTIREAATPVPGSLVRVGFMLPHLQVPEGCVARVREVDLSRATLTLELPGRQNPVVVPAVCAQELPAGSLFHRAFTLRGSDA
jgi:hypothetical protein